MLMKIFSTALLAATLLLTACGQKLPEVDADKAVTAYAQLYTCGTIDDELRPAVNLSDADIAQARAQLVKVLTDAVEKYPLADETIDAIAKKLLDRLHSIMDITATLKDGDSAHPTVELVVTSINLDFVKSFAAEDDDVVALKSRIDELHVQGVTDDELKADPEVQKLALDAIGGFVGEIFLNAEATILVPCKIVTGADGKLYWQPEDVQSIARFISGQQ